MGHHHGSDRPTSARVILHTTDQNGPNIWTWSVFKSQCHNYQPLFKHCNTSISGQAFCRKILGHVLHFFNLVYEYLRMGVIPRGAGGAAPWHTHILLDQLTLSKPGGADYAHHITTGTLDF